LYRTAYGHGRRLAGIRRGAPVAPRRKRRIESRPPDRAELVRKGFGFEAFLAVADREHLPLPHLLRDEDEAAAAVHEGIALSNSRREGFLVSTILHLIIFIIVIVKPDLLAPADREPEVHPKDRLVLVVEPPPPPAEPLVLPPLPPPPQAQPSPPDSDRMVIPKATQPPPPEMQQDFQNDLPFAEGNTDEFFTDEEQEEPGEEGEATEADVAAAQAEEAKRLADLLPRDDFVFGGTRSAPPAQPETPASEGSRARDQQGGGGPFEDIRRFMEDKQFHNPEGGLVTGRDNTLYYDDKGANFVPWIRRMLTEVRRNWLVPYSASFRAGHVAVAVSVDRNGDIVVLEVMIPSGTPGFDNAAQGALRAADLQPLPLDYPDDHFEFVLVFWYNERPYDLF
jgi:TonB family protein